MQRRYLLLAIFITSIGVAISCHEKKATPESDRTDSDVYRVHKTYGTGPVKFEIGLSADSITTADALTFTLILEVAEGYQAEFPDLEFADDVPGLLVTDFSEREEKREGRRRLIRAYELEPEYDGTLEVPALQVYYHQSNDIREDMLESEAVKITVSKTPESAEALALKPTRGLMTAEEMEAEHRRIWPWIVGVIGIIIIVVLASIYWARRPRRLPPPVPAHEVALEALRRLVAGNLIDKGLIERFFVEITGIVRDYIEQAFGLRAPEQTTEEFLANIASQPVVARHRKVLEPFLAAADEVKFARMIPDKNVIQRTFDTARDFIVQTAKADRLFVVRNQSGLPPKKMRTKCTPVATEETKAGGGSK